MRILISFLMPWLAFATPERDRVPQYEYIRLPASLVDARFVKDTGFIRDHNQSERYAFGYLTKDAMSRLRSADVVLLDAWEWATHQHNADTLARINEPATDTKIYEAFHTYNTLTEELQTLAKTYPTLSKLESIGKTVEGRDMWLLRLTSQKLADPAKPKLLYASSMHGDEVTGKEMLVYLARELLSGYGKDSRLTSLMDNSEIFLIPSINPDGTELRQRWNAKGVDLNRDFPEMNEDAFSTAGRAPETKALMELHRNHYFPIAMNFHGGSLCVNLPWDHKGNSGASKFGDDAVVGHLAREYARTNLPMLKVNFGSFTNGITYGFEWYQVLGGMQDWSIYFRDSIHTTLEISDVKWPSATQLPNFWAENRNSLLNYLEGGLNGLHLQVSDPQGNLVPEVSVAVSSASRTLNYPGVVHRTTIPSDQVVTLNAEGFMTKTLTLPAVPFRGEYQQVTLQRNLERKTGVRTRLTWQKGGRS